MLLGLMPSKCSYVVPYRGSVWKMVVSRNETIHSFLCTADRGHEFFPPNIMEGYAQGSAHRRSRPLN